MAHAPRSGKDVFCWDWNVRVGCARGGKCDRKHASMGDKNLHWAVSADMIRRGGHVKRESRIAPENIDGAIDQLRGSNKRTHGEQPIAPSKAWWQKTDGPHSGNLNDQSCNGNPEPGWKVAKRDLNWGAINQRADNPEKLPPDGRNKVELSPLYPNREKPEASEPKFLKAPVTMTSSNANAKATCLDRSATDRRAGDVRKHGNPAAPLPPDDLEEWGLTMMGEKLTQSMYADDRWVEDLNNPKMFRPSVGEDGLNERKKTVDKWWWRRRW